VENFNIFKDYISRYFTIKNFSSDPENPYFILDDYDADKFAFLVNDMAEAGYVPAIEKYGEDYRIWMNERPPLTKSKYHINIILFIATVATTIYAGYIFGGGSILDGIEFSIAIMAIIGIHELAHYFAARKYKVEATLPYFIPAPTMIGTFGAVINVKSPIPTRNALFDLGVSGPLAGIIITIPVLFIGIYLSTVVPIKTDSIIFIPPLIMSIIAYFAAPAVPNGYMLQIHPVAFAGWVGVVVTMLNLMPVAFLDGGHISRSIFSEKIHKLVSLVGIAVTLLLGWIPMGILMIVILFMAKKHPGALDNISKLSKNRKILAGVVLVVFILCLAPVPLPYS